MPTYMDLITNSRAKLYRRCKRAHRLQYVDGYRAVAVDEPLRFGNLLHLGLEAWWRQRLPSPPQVALGDFMRPYPEPWALPLVAAQAALAAAPHPDEFQQIVLQELLYGYTVRWGGDGYQALAVETAFYMPLVDPATGQDSAIWDLGGKLDVMATRPDEPQVIIEHKSSGEDIGVGSNYWKRLRMDSQASIYFDGAKSAGFDPLQVVYDVVGKPKIRRLEATPEAERKYTKATTTKGAGGGSVVVPPRLYANQRAADETPDEWRLRLRELLTSPEGQARYYVRDNVARTDAMMAMHRADLWAQAQEMAQGTDYRNPDACVLYGRTCAFHDVCSTGNTALLDDRERFVKLADPHVELASEQDRGD